MTRFRLNPAVIQQLQASPRYRTAERGIAEQAKRSIEAVAPSGRTGLYKRISIYVRREGARLQVGTTDPFAHLIEYGSANNPAYAPLRRGVTAAGLRLKEAPKP